MPRIMSTLASRVKEAVSAANEKGYTVANIAKRCGISVQAVYQWIEGSTKELKGSSLTGLAELSGYSPWYINDGKGEKILHYAKTEQQKNILKIMQPLPIEEQAKVVRVGSSLVEPDEGTNGKQ